MTSSKALFHLSALVVIFFMAIMGVSTAGPLAHADDIKSMNAGKSGIVKYWTKERMENAIPRDLAIDQRGLGYLRKPDGSFVPYGHQIEVETPRPLVKPGSNTDMDPPNIENMDPAEGTTIYQSTITFSAKVTDNSGIKAVSFVIASPNGTTQAFSPLLTADDIWKVVLQGFSDGNWKWWVNAKDTLKNSITTDSVSFTVDTSVEAPPPDPDTDNTITNAEWIYEGAVQTAAGRIYFEMPVTKNPKAPWQGYVCSGTVVNDGTSGRSVILTAGHCVYDDVHKAFARNVLFIPKQAETEGTGTDLTCSNDPLGCWVPSFGVVDINWTATTFPANIKWDYAFYVVADSGAHAEGLNPTETEILDVEAGTLSVSFSTPAYINSSREDSPYTHALGYSYDHDPDLMYCAEDMTTIEENDWWLSSCELSGGSSGGPWVQPMDVGSGPIISVNSWGYTTSPGMAGPMLDTSSAQCVFSTAIDTSFDAITYEDGKAGTTYSGVCP